MQDSKTWVRLPYPPRFIVKLIKIVMKKIELIKSLAEKTGESQSEVEKVIDAFAKVVIEKVRDEGDEITLHGLGTFKKKSIAAHNGRNPMNGKKVSVPASENITFKVSSGVKKVL